MSWVSAELEKAKARLAEHNYKGAIKSLWIVESFARSDKNEARGMLEVATTVRDHTDGRLRKQSEQLVELAQHAVNRVQPIAELARDGCADGPPRRTRSRSCEHAA